MQINKLEGMFYKISGNEIELNVVKKYDNYPDQHIDQCIYTDNTNFWDFVFDAVIELKQEYLYEIEDGETTQDRINRAKVYIEELRGVEKALLNLISKSKRSIIDGVPPAPSILNR